MTMSLCMGLYENVVVVIVRCRDILPPVEGSLVRKRVASPQGSPHPLLHTLSEIAFFQRVSSAPYAASMWRSQPAGRRRRP